MQVSLETLSGLERRLTIEVPAEKIESQIQSRLQDAARNFNMKGFRKGKVPLKVIKSRFGKGLRQEVLGEVMSQSFYEAVSKEDVRPAGQPRIEPKSIEEGKDFSFTATFEVFPEIKLGDFSKIKVVRKNAAISAADVDEMIETLRKQKQTWQEVERAAQDKDQVNIDFTGFIGTEKFQGGEVKGHDLVLGSGSMIPGFEEGLIGAVKGEDRKLAVKFPENYQSSDLAGKDAVFDVHVNSVSEQVLPKLDKEFYAAFGVEEGGKEAFRKEVKRNMERELRVATKNNVKTQVIDGLLENHEVEMPKALLDQEIGSLKQQAIRQFGGNAKIDPSVLPDDMFRGQAAKRLKVGLLINEVITRNKLKADPKRVRELIEDMAEAYEDPQEVVNWYYGNQEQLANIEGIALEEAAIDLILEAAAVDETEVSYEEAIKAIQSRSDRKIEQAMEAEEQAAVGESAEAPDTGQAEDK